MVQKFSGRPKADAIKVNMNLTLDVPAEFAEQIELWVFTSLTNVSTTRSASR